MKTRNKKILTILTLCLMSASIATAYPVNRNVTDNPFKVKSKNLILMRFTQFKHNDSYMNIYMDIPVNVPKVLTDSITRFFNEELYRLFDNGGDRHLAYAKVFSTDLSKLSKHYWKAYRPFYDKDAPYITPFVHWFELNMVAQTDNYVTYEIVSGYRGEGAEEARSWATFDKSDGHRLKEVISTENMLRFFQEHPEIRNDDIWDNIQYYLNEGYNVFLNNVGLLSNSVAFQYMWNMGIYEDFTYDLEVIKPYLSKEAQELISH